MLLQENDEQQDLVAVSQQASTVQLPQQEKENQKQKQQPPPQQHQQQQHNQEHEQQHWLQEVEVGALPSVVPVAVEEVEGVGQPGVRALKPGPTTPFQHALQTARGHLSSVSTVAWSGAEGSVGAGRVVHASAGTAAGMHSKPPPLQGREPLPLSSFDSDRFTDDDEGGEGEGGVPPAVEYYDDDDDDEDGALALAAAAASGPSRGRRESDESSEYI
jgi:hypothetical protein